MADPIHLDVIKRISAIIETINPLNADPGTAIPYTIDLRNKVFRGLTELGQGESDSLPAVSILEAPRPVPGLPVGQEKLAREEILTLLLQGFVKDDKKHPSDPAYVLKAQVEQALARIIQIDRSTGNPVHPDDYMLGKWANGKHRLSGLTIQTGLVRPKQTGVSSTAFFYIPISAKFLFDPSAPWAT